MTTINLSELSWVNRDRWPKELKYGLCVAIAVVCFACVYFFLISPSFDEYDRMLVEEEKLKQDYEKKYGLIVNLKVYEEQLNEMNTRFGMLLKQLPTQNEMPGLLEDISKTGVACGLTFELFAPSKEVEHPYYVDLPVNISVVGTYNQLATFVSRVAKISRVVTIHDFTITPAKVDKVAMGLDSTVGERLVMSITIKIYRYRAI